MNMLNVMVASLLSAEIIQDLGNKGIEIYQLKSDEQLDRLENYIKGTENKYDDKLLPLIAAFRKAANIPDNDVPTKE